MWVRSKLHVGKVWQSIARVLLETLLSSLAPVVLFCRLANMVSLCIKEWGTGNSRAIHGLYAPAVNRRLNESINKEMGSDLHPLLLKLF